MVQHPELPPADTNLPAARTNPTLLGATDAGDPGTRAGQGPESLLLQAVSDKRVNVRERSPKGSYFGTAKHPDDLPNSNYRSGGLSTCRAHLSQFASAPPGAAEMRTPKAFLVPPVSIPVINTTQPCILLSQHT